MAKKQNNAACAVCGKDYYLCIACDRHKSTWKPWMVIVDNENCYNIYDIVMFFPWLFCLNLFSFDIFWICSFCRKKRR